jgi:hypothetical protein
MKARNWTTWEGYLPSAKVQTRTGTAALCLKPWDQILPEEGVEERMGCIEPLWRTWERYLPLEKADVAAHLLSVSVDEGLEKADLSTI